MSFEIFSLVIFAAFLHAVWNVLVKLKLDRFSTVCLMQTGLGLFGLALVAVYGLPPFKALPFALAACVVHTFYLVFLAKAYENGEFSLTYPIARGTAPLFTLLGSSLVASEGLNTYALGGVLILIIGLLFLALPNANNLRSNRLAVIYALATAAMISCYTLLDGYGSRASGSAAQYAGLTFALYGGSIFATGLFLRGRTLISDLAPHWSTGLVGGGISALAYFIVIWCMTEAPIAMVAALRETSVLFGVMLSAFILKERLTLGRIAGGMLIVAGAMLLRLS